jgi:sec-independent protein translocase protein TatA
MGEFSVYHWLLVLVVIILLFGGRQIPLLMRGLGEGIRNFKDGMHGTHGETGPRSTEKPDGRKD